jgi:hypothetical protein
LAAHERSNPGFDFAADFAPTAHVADQPWIPDRKPSEHGGRHIMGAQIAFDFSPDVHLCPFLHCATHAVGFAPNRIRT